MLDDAEREKLINSRYVDYDQEFEDLVDATLDLLVDRPKLQAVLRRSNSARIRYRSQLHEICEQYGHLAKAREAEREPRK